MRKVLSFVLVLSLVLGSFSMAFAATPKDVVGAPSEEAVTVLSDLGVVSGYEDGTYKPENIVTRAEMAVLVIRALGLTDYVTTAAKSSFKDMAGYGWAEGYIAYAKSLGFVSGYPDGTFKPGQTVSYDEAASMLVRALGYSPETLPGSWPANFVVKAKALGILDGIQAGAKGANRGDVAIMLYQALDQRIGAVNKDGDWVDNDTTKDGSKPDTMLSRLGAKYIPAEVLTNEHVDKASINIKKYLGAFAVTYEKNDKIIAVGEVESTFIKGDFAADNKFEGDDDVTYSLPSGFSSTTPAIAWFTNGEQNTSVTAAAITGSATIAVDVSGKTVKEVYSVQTWTITAADQVDKDDVAQIKEDGELLGASFVTLKDDSIDTNSFELVGVASLDDIATDDVVFVYCALNDDAKDITKVSVSNKVVNGKVTKVNSAGDKFTIDGKEYKISSAPGANASLALGDEVKAYLDPAGKVYAVDKTNTSAGNYAVVITAPAQDGTFKAEYKAELFTKAGEENVYTFKNKDAYDNSIAASTTKGSLALFNVNKDGKMTELTATGAALSGQTLSKKGVLGGKLLADNVVIFVKDGNDYSIVKPENVKDDVALTGFYHLDKNDKIAALVIQKTATEYTESYGLIQSYSSVEDQDGDPIFEVVAVVDGKKVTLFTEDATTTTENLVKENAVLYKFSLDESVITDLEPMAFVANASLITSTQAAVYTGSPDWTTVSAVDGSRLNMNNAGFEVVADAAAYYPTFDSDGEFVAWNVGKISSIAKDYKAILIQASKDSDNYDIVLYVKKADADKAILKLDF